MTAFNPKTHLTLDDKLTQSNIRKFIKRQNYACWLINAKPMTQSQATEYTQRVLYNPYTTPDMLESIIAELEAL